MSETTISEIKLETSKEEFSSDDNVTVNVRFSVMGNLRESFTEKTGLRHMKEMIIHSNSSMALNCTKAD